MPPTYTELAGSPTENGSREEFSATMKLKCAWEDRDAVMAYFGNVLYPVVYPHRPAMRAIVQSIGCAPFGEKVMGEGGLATYESAEITVNFSNKVDSETMCVESIEPAAEFMGLDPSLFAWTDGTAVTVDEAPGILIQSLVYELEFPQATMIPAGYIAAVSHVNAAAFSTLTLGLTFAAQTLLYTPRRCTRTIRTDEMEAWNLGMSFAYKPSGWNKWFRPSSGTYEGFKFRSGGAPYTIYETYDFNTLKVSPRR
jgi:hypothetical protein